MIQMSVTGWEQLKESIKKLPANAQKAAMDALHQEIVAIYARAQATVPVRTGYLKSTGKIVKDGKLSESIAYSADYAVYVHERPGFSKGYKWLKKAFDSQFKGMVARIKAAIVKALNKK